MNRRQNATRTQNLVEAQLRMFQLVRERRLPFDQQFLWACPAAALRIVPVVQVSSVSKFAPCSGQRGLHFVIYEFSLQQLDAR
jgi:hypothetical protein